LREDGGGKGGRVKGWVECRGSLRRGRSLRGGERKKEGLHYFKPLKKGELREEGGEGDELIKKERKVVVVVALYIDLSLLLKTRHLRFFRESCHPFPSLPQVWKLMNWLKEGEGEGEREMAVGGFEDSIEGERKNGGLATRGEEG
jgi:hypothetical protein